MSYLKFTNLSDLLMTKKNTRRNRMRFPSSLEIVENQIRLKLKRGLEYFDIDGVQILALNKKNAIRKAKAISNQQTKQP